MPKSKTSLNDLVHEIKRVAESREVLTNKKIEAIYQSLYDDLNKFVSKQYVKYADKDGRVYISYLDKERKRAWFMNEIAKSVDGVSLSLKKEIMSLVDKTYSTCYEGMIEALRTVTSSEEFKNIAKDIQVRPEVLKQAVNNNISKLTLPTVLERNRAEIIVQLQQELNIGLMNGDRYETMAKRISERLNISKGKAMNITRTETHRNIESGFLDCAENLSDKLEGSDYIYAATWRTMKDNRVRPQRVYHTSKGWKVGKSTNGANHIQMEGVTVKVGELFDLGEGIKTKAPSKSGYAKHDCNCRCFLEYNLVTVSEFAALTDLTEEEIRKKYGMGEKVEMTSSVKEIDLTSDDEPYIIDLPKSLEHFEEYQVEWVNNNMYIPRKDKKTLQEGIQAVIDNNAFSMRVNAKDLQNIIDEGFKNQFETKTSGGTLSRQSRTTASYRLFGNEAHKMKDSEFEKYGYLGSKDFTVDYKTSYANQYGKTIVKFNKDRLKDRVTYTVDDSLGNALYNEVIGGKIGDECSISGVPLTNADDLIEYFKESDWADIDNADEIAQLMGCRYWEIQYHGKLTIDDVESICFTKTDRDKVTNKMIKQLKDHNIKVYQIQGRGSDLVEM